MAYAIMEPHLAWPTNNRGNHTVSRRIIFIVLLASLSACQSLSPTHPDAAQTSDDHEEKTSLQAHGSRPFPADTLYELLVAEFAGLRGQPKIAQQKYHEQALITRDVDLARRATQIAEFTGATELMLDSAQLWGDLEPHNTEAQTLVAISLVKQGKLDEAFDQSLTLVANGQRPFFQAIAFQAIQQDRDAQNRLLDRFRQALTQYPANTELLTGESLLLHYLGDDERALQSVNQAIDADEENTAAYVLKASLLEKLGEPKEAARILRKRLKVEPHNQRLRLQYARLLTEFDLPEAQKQFRILVDSAPLEPDLILSLALVSEEMGDFATAREYFEQLLFLRKHTSIAYFYLAQISEKQQDIPRATELYRRVVDGEDYLHAAAAICRLYMAQTQIAECQKYMQHERQRHTAVNTQTSRAIIARLYLIEVDVLHQYKSATELAVLNEALEKFPDNADLRYIRSMLYEQANHLVAAEADLRLILSKDPDNANALNALGYTLVNKTDRLQEGYELITRALALEPDNAAILDSMGWALYRLNRNEEAVLYLQKAMISFPNHEVAAHLGEVLWISGQKREARKIWQQGLEDDPDSAIIQETRSRLNAE